MLGFGWKGAQATIVDRRLVDKHTESDSGEFAGQGFEVYEYIADIAPQTGERFRTTLREPRNGVTFKSPEIGQVVLVKYQQGSKRAKFDRSDAGTYRKVPGLPSLHRHRDVVTDADAAGVAADHTDGANARWNDQASQPPDAEA